MQKLKGILTQNLEEIQSRIWREFWSRIRWGSLCKFEWDSNAESDGDSEGMILTGFLSLILAEAFLTGILLQNMLGTLRRNPTGIADHNLKGILQNLEGI